MRTAEWIFGRSLVLALGITLILGEGSDFDLRSQAELLLKSPDLMVSNTYELETRPEILEKLLGSPILLSRLWDAYQFSPSYRLNLQGANIHVVDPTGISGDVVLVEQSGNRRVYLATGALHHNLVPAFQGKMALVLTTVPKGSAIRARVDAYLRADSRVLGFLAWTMGPLLKLRVENRMNMNAADVGTILKHLATEPHRAVELLRKEDAAALLKLLPLGTAR
jgi:hypothetical protein